MRTSSVEAICKRMEKWNSDFLRKVLGENKNKEWQKAAKIVLTERKENMDVNPVRKKFIPDPIRKAYAAKHRALDNHAAQRRWGIS